jgi:hypothetical protein
MKMIVPRKIRWAEHVAFVGERKCSYTVLMGKPEGRDHLERLNVDGRLM